VGLKDWVLHALTGAWVTDHCVASATGMLNVHTLTWDEEALRLGGITADMLPEPVAPPAEVGRVTDEAAALTGLPAGLPVIAGGSDGAMASFGTGVAGPGQMVITVGTSGAVRRIVERPWFHPGEGTFCYVLGDGLWFAGGQISNGGLALEWARARLYPDLSPMAGVRQLLGDAATVPPGAEGVFWLPYFTGERSPYWTPNDRAMIYGLGIEHGRAHLARAVLEGVAHCLADVWDALDGAGPRQGVARLTGGITSSPLWTQILTDVLGTPLMALEAADTSAAGAGLLGLRTLGCITDEQLATTVTPGPVYSPDPARHTFYVEHHRQFHALRQR
jgi:gluconokinase